MLNLYDKVASFVMFHSVFVFSLLYFSITMHLSFLLNSFSGFTLLIAGTVIGVVIYTGKETRSVMNTSNPKNKVC